MIHLRFICDVSCDVSSIKITFFFLSSGEFRPISEPMFQRTLITSALPYANGPIHLGHLAGAYLPADLYTRFLRLNHEDVLHICGSDEHGVPITIAAEKEGVSPQEIVDRYHEMNRSVFEQFGIQFDYYGRTSSATHLKTSADFFTTLYEKGAFVEKTEEQLFDEKAGMFLPDRYVKGTCPKCGYEEAYGDQCEKCGTALSPAELINPVSTITGNQPVLKSTSHWYIQLGEMQEQIEAWIGTREHWKPNVTGQVKSWLDAGLTDRAVTRDLTWGVPVPLEGAEGKVLYVWFDAPIGYISATREWADAKGEPEAWKTYWQDKDTRLIHFIGKDNIVFHCIMFPAMLMEHGGYVLPDMVPANEFLNLEGQKLSTSRGWAVWLQEYLDNFDADLLRYVLGTTLPETKDSDFSWNDFQSRVNNELADILGNFVFRTTSFTHRFFDGKVPELLNPSELDKDTLKSIGQYAQKIAERYRSFRFRDAITETMNLARTGNRYFTETEPWKTRKENPEACANTIHVCTQICAALSIMMDPVLPGAMKNLREQFDLADSLAWQDISDHLAVPGTKIQERDILFQKVEDELVEKEMQKLTERSRKAQGNGSQGATKEGEESQGEGSVNKQPPVRENTDFDTFMKVDLRAGKITHAEPVKKSKKLLKLTVDLGFETRTILSGIAGHVSAESLPGQSVCVVANLAPRMMMGIESNGMVLMAEEPDGTLRFVETEAAPGSPIT